MPRITALLLAAAATFSTMTAGPAAGAAGTPATPGGVDLLSAGPSAVRLGVTAPEPELVTPDSLAAGSALLHLDGWDLGRSPGIPALPSRVVRVAVPPTGAVTVRGYGLTSATRDGVTLAPSRGSGDPAALTANGGHLAPERARLLGVTWMRNQRVAVVEILPCDYEPAAKRLTSWSRIELEVDFAPAGATTPAERVDPFEAIYAGTLVNYEQGKSWRRSTTTLLGGFATRNAAGRSSSPVIAATSRFVGHTWVKIAIPKNGFYRITYGQLRLLAPFSGVERVAYSDLRLYAWPGRPVLSETVTCDTCDYRQVALAVENKSAAADSLDSNDDAFSFYAQGPSDWANHYDPSVTDSAYIQNPYAVANYCYLSFDNAAGDARFTDTPARIAPNSLDVTPGPGGGAAHPVSFRERLRFEKDSGNEYFPSVWLGAFPHPDNSSEPWDWSKFMWRTVSIGGTFQTLLSTPDPLAGTTAYVRTRIWGTARNTAQNLPVCATTPNHSVDVVVVNSAGYDSTSADFADVRPPTARLFLPVDTLTTLKFRVRRSSDPNGCPERIDQSTLDFSEIYYSRRFVPVNDELTFDSPGQGDVIYAIGPFSSGELPRIYDITDPFAPIEMTTDAAAFLATDTLKIEVNESGPRRYAFVPNSHFLKPAITDFVTASSVSLDDLRSPHVADHVIIYYDGFQLAADSLGAWRRSHMPLVSHPAPYHVVEVPVSAIFDQFSGGRTDPVALRLFLRAAWNNWDQSAQGGHDAPTFVTFLGDASFDFRNLLALAEPGEPGSLLPSFEDNGVAGDQYSSDDWLLNKDDDVAVNVAIPDFIGGRIPAGDPASAMDYVTKKLFPQERSAPTGPWRNRVMLVADDDQQGDHDDVSFHWTHVAQTATLDSLHLPKHVDRAYVYLHTYPDGPGRTKPGAKADIKNTINGDGIVAFNYIGHGSPFKLSDESVLIDVDAGTFVNASKLPLFVAASCDVGKFNDPRVQSLGERLLFGVGGGTIAVISASEIAFSFPNVTFNYALYDELFDRSSATGQFWEPIGRALLNAKLQTGTDPFDIQNNQKYHLMGDAAVQLHLPQLWVDVEIDDEAGTTPVAEVHGGQTLTCKGRVLDREIGGSLVPYSGVVDVLIEDSAPRQITPPCAKAKPEDCALQTYDFRAGAIFRGSMVVTGGTFSGQFVVPLEANGGPRGRVRAYVEGFPNQPPQTDGVGSLRLQISPGNAPPGDASGPSISLSFPGGVTSVKPDAVLRIELSDPSGILTTGHTVQNGIIVTVDGNTTARIDATSTFRYAANSHTTGTATFALPNLPAGEHTISVSAADNFAGGLTAFQHRSNASITFQVADAPPISIRNAYLFPNPTESGRRQSGGTFVVDGPGDSANVMVRLFTVSGRMIRELKSFGTFGQVQVPWDGLDAEGYPLANGTYLFKVYVNGRDETGKSSARQKAARDGRFVVLNH